MNAKITYPLVMLSSMALLACFGGQQGMDSKDNTSSIDAPQAVAAMQSKSKTEVVVSQLGDNHWGTYTEIIIDASAEKVWEVLTDWDTVSYWSSSLKGLTGAIKNGGEVIVSYSVNGNTFKIPHILVYSEGLEFGWSDPMGGRFKGLSDNHRYRVEAISDSQSRFIHTDDFKGTTSGELTAEMLARSVAQSYPVFNLELKKQVESRQ